MYAEILAHDPKPPRQIDSRVPRELERVCLKCLSKRRTDRYNTTDDLRDDLLAWLREQQSALTGLVGANHLLEHAYSSQSIFPAEDSGTPVATETSPANAVDRREIAILLQRVKQFWVDGVLANSMHRAVLIQLGKETRVDALAHPWEQILELPKHSPAAVLHDKRIDDLFDDIGHALLVLGEPGSGKTTTLLELARALITRVEKDKSFSQPIPVVDQSIEVAEGCTPYGLPT